jgi:hypothetical protein
MTALRFLLPLAMTLTACGGSSGGGTGTDASTSNDTNTNADTNTSNGSIHFRAVVTDGFTNARIEGGEFCVVEPVQDGDSCGTTDADGLADWVWITPAESNFTSRFTHPDYTSMLYLGHWDDQVAAAFKNELESTGRITTDFGAFTTPVMNGWLGGGGITPESGAGHIFIFVGGTSSDTALDGITASLSDASGTVVYWGVPPPWTRR